MGTTITPHVLIWVPVCPTFTAASADYIAGRLISPPTKSTAAIKITAIVPEKCLVKI
jgi:hypothetical protein